MEFSAVLKIKVKGIFMERSPKIRLNGKNHAHKCGVATVFVKKEGHNNILQCWPLCKKHRDGFNKQM